LELVGRGTERRRLTTALADAETGLVIVRGPSGAGKTALVEAVLSELAPRGYIIGRGKYAEGDATSGFAPILQALSQSVSTALDLLYDPAAGAESLRKTLGSQLSLLESAGFGPIDVLASPERTASPPLHGGEGKARIVDAIARLIRWLYGFGTPVVLFIDDWQRAPQEAHPLATIATRDQSLRLCTVIFAERSGESDFFGSKRPHAELIELGPLHPKDQAALLGAAVGDSAAGAAIDAWLAGNSTGLPFDLQEAARALLERSAIGKKDGAWIVDSAAAASIDRHDIANTIVTRARALPPGVLEVGVAFALWGDRTPIARVAEALNRPLADISRAVMRLQQEGIVSAGQADVSFAHDRMRVGILTASDPAARAALAAEMAERLRASGAGSLLLRPALKFRIAAGLTDAAPALWRDHFASEAALARNVADNATANSFAEAAWALRARERGPDQAADALVLREASLAAAARRDSALVRSRVEEMIALSIMDDQVADAYQTAIHAASMAGEPELAWTWALAGLRHFGLRLPAKVRKINLLAAVAQWRLSRFLPRRNLPPGHTVETITPLRRIVNFAALIAYSRDPRLMLLCSLHSSTMAHRFGYQSAYYQSVDVILYAEFGNARKAAELGAAILGSAMSPTAFGRGATLYRALYSGLIWTVPMVALRDHLTKVYDVAISECDVTYATQAVRNFTRIVWRIEPTLDGLAALLKDSIEKAEQLGDAIGLPGMRALAETLKIFQNPRGFVDLDDEPWTRLGVIAGMGPPIIWMEILSMRGDWAGVLALAERFDAGRVILDPHPGGAIWRFHENLARLKLGLPLRRGDLRYIRRAAGLNPADHRRKLLILEAERLRRKGAAEACLSAYANAVEVASSGSSRLEAGIAAECAAAAARSFGKHDVAARCDALAISIWNAWGAFAKTGGKPVVEQGDALSIAPQLADAELKAALADRSERAKSRFLAEVGHELRTPLQGMQGLLDLAAEAPSEVSMSELREVFGSLKTVVDDLTDLAALGGGAPLHLKPMDIAALVEQESRMAALSAKRKGIAFSIELQPSSLTVKIDNTRVRQVVRNLLSNAVKYTDRGEINLRLTGTATDARTVGISVAVEDSGPGLTDTQLLRLFEPFDRAERDDGEGLGLGLALSRRIAERMGGTLTAENRTSGGAAFIFRFDAERADNVVAAGPTASPLRIMLVEDVPLNRRMIATMLRRAGHTVSEAEDGLTALRLSQSQRFDLILLDVGLPDIDGFQVLEALKRSARGAAAVVIILTASTAPSIAERARSLGAALVLRKPISIDELRGAIQSVFALHPQNDPRAFAAFEAELEGLSRQARAEILARGRSILSSCEPTDATIRDVHRLAGLSGQFGAPEVASAADFLEAELVGGSKQPISLKLLESALTQFAATIEQEISDESL
jgi:signal transduction histidine kinase/DNA-binding response OmpR family regulator